jgi:outer membrane receptor protein involved in Fe transport
MDLSGFDDWDYDLSQYDLNYYKEILGTNNDIIAQTAMNMDNQVYYNDTALHNIKPHYSNEKRDYYIYGKLKLKDFIIGFSTFKRDEGYGAWYRDDFELGPDNGGRWVPNNSFLYLKYEKKISDRFSFTSFTRFKEHKLLGNSHELYYMGYFNKNIGLSGLVDENGLLLPDSLITNPYWYLTWYHTYSIQMRTEFYTKFSPSKKLDIITGLELRKGFIQGAYLISEEPKPEETAYPPDIEGGNNFQSTDIGLYAQLNYEILDNLNIFLGGRLDNNKVRLTGGYGTVFMPKMALIYRPGDFSLKFIYSEAYKDAGFWTKYGVTAGRLLNNPNLKPEKVQNYETSVLWNISKNLFIDFSAYIANYNNAVGTVIVDYVDESGDTIQTTQHQAIGSMQISGIQSNIIYKTNHYSAYFNYTYTHPYNTENDEKIRIGDIASHKFNAGIDVFLLKKLNINLRMNYVGEKPVGKNTTISENPLNKIDAYWLFNGSVAYKISTNFRLQLSVNNILNNLYYDPGVRSADGIYYAARLPQNERNFMLKLFVDF